MTKIRLSLEFAKAAVSADFRYAIVLVSNESVKAPGACDDLCKNLFDAYIIRDRLNKLYLHKAFAVFDLRNAEACVDGTPNSCFIQEEC